jgi:hypothetical protein
MSTDTADLKRWTTARACACRVGVIACRTDPIDGPRMYFTIRFGVPRQHADLAALEAYVAEIAQATHA